MYNLGRSLVLRVLLTEFLLAGDCFGEETSFVSCNFLYNTRFSSNSSKSTIIFGLGYEFHELFRLLEMKQSSRFSFYQELLTPMCMYPFLWIIVFKLSYLNFCICLTYSSTENIGILNRAQMKAIYV